MLDCFLFSSNLIIGFSGVGSFTSFNSSASAVDSSFCSVCLFSSSFCSGESAGTSSSLLSFDPSSTFRSFDSTSCLDFSSNSSSAASPSSFALLASVSLASSWVDTSSSFSSFWFCFSDCSSSSNSIFTSSNSKSSISAKILLYVIIEPKQNSLITSILLFKYFSCNALSLNGNREDNSNLINS